jgi:signal transduction histidine kinase
VAAFDMDEATDTDTGAQLGASFWRQRSARLTFSVAAALTVTMLVWQGVHLYYSFSNVDHRQSGDCPTRAVEEVYFAAAHHADLIDDLEHAILVVPDIAFGAWSAEWRAHFRSSSEALDSSIADATPLVTAELDAALERTSQTATEIEKAAEAIVDNAEVRGIPSSAAALKETEYVSSRTAYVASVEGLVIQSRRFFESQLRSEHRSELISVTGAIIVFGAAIGAWGVFLRQIRRGQRQLAAATKRRQVAERELRQAQKMEALGTMAGAVAHDFDNLLTAIAGSTDVARIHLDAESPAHEPLATVTAATEQGNELVRGLLTFGRRTSFQAEPVDVGSLVTRTVSLVQTMIPTGITVSVMVPDDSGPFVIGDAVQLQQALMNLILNARDAMSSGGCLTIRAHVCGGEDGLLACIQVSDTGGGMTSEVRERIFEPFFSGGERAGTGLGLAIVHGVVTRHHGEVRCVSEVGEGTTFTVTLPAITAELGAAADSRTPQPHEAQEDRGLVLIAEHRRHIRELLAMAVEAAGYTTEQPADPSSLIAAEAAHRGKIVALVIDTRAPEMDVVVHRLRSEGNRTPIVLIAPAGDGDHQPDEVDPATRILTEPFPIHRLVELIDAAARNTVGARG